MVSHHSKAWVWMGLDDVARTTRVSHHIPYHLVMPMLIMSRSGADLEQPRYLVAQIMSKSRGTDPSIVRLSRALWASTGGLALAHVNLPQCCVLEGPRGSHACLIYPPHHVPLCASIHPLTSHPPLTENAPRLPLHTIKSILKHTLLGIESIHRVGWIHGAVGLHSLEITTHSLPPELAQGPEDQILLEKIRHTPGGAYAPLYLTKTRPIPAKREDFDDEDITILLGNLGYGKKTLTTQGRVAVGDANRALAAFPASESVHSWHTIAGPYQFRAPEMLYPIEDEISWWTSRGGVDIWAFGCLVYRLYTGHHIIPEIRISKEDPDHAIFEYWLSIARIFGRLPDPVIEIWPELSTWSEPSANSFFPVNRRLRDKLDEHAHPDLTERELTVISGLTQLALTTSPRSRPTASTLLQHAFFKD